jgi:hypothetical protein
LPWGRPVEIKVKWPVLLLGVSGMKLLIHGRIIRCEENHKLAAVRMESQEKRFGHIL